MVTSSGRESFPAEVRFVASHARPNNHHATTSLRIRDMKVTINEWNAVAAWRWDMPDDDVCGICRNPYDSTCSKCKFPGDECPLCKLYTYAFSLRLDDSY
jgi:hypothetical protein